MEKKRKADEEKRKIDDEKRKAEEELLKKHKEQKKILLDLIKIDQHHYQACKRLKMEKEKQEKLK